MEPEKWLLLVEDNEDDVLLMNRALSRQGFCIRVVTARDGAEALEILLGRRAPALEPRFAPLPSLVLLDVNLPKLSGLDVLERIRQHEPTALLRVVMFTTSGHESDVARSYRSGVSSYVRKPVSSAGFQEIVRSIGRYWLELNQCPLALAG